MIEKEVRDESPHLAYIADKVQVYWHFRKKCFSIRHKGKVVRHADHVALRDCKFKVSKKGNERVRREGRKNVHAVIEGTLVYIADPGTAIFMMPDVESRKVTYNPYKNVTFVDQDGNEVHEARVVICSTEKGVVATCQ